MTLLVSLVSNDRAVLLSDRLLTVVSGGRGHLQPSSTKQGFVYADTARFLYAYTGLAETKGFKTDQWIADCLVEASATSSDLNQLLPAFRRIASRDFIGRPELKALSKSNQRLKIIFVGFLNDGRAFESWVSNCTDEKAGQFLAEANDTFDLFVGGSERVTSETIAFARWHGSTQAIAPKDFEGVIQLLKDQKPPLAVIGKAVEVIREIANRPASNGTIGHELLASRIEPTVGGAATSSYWPSGGAPALIVPGIIDLRSASPMKGSILSRIQISAGGVTFVDPKTPRNANCPCGSGKKYKHCHGRRSKSKFRN